VDAGEPVPADPGPYSGFAFMGGPMSVNDELPWIPRVLALINAAVRADIPVLGHCLGGQLISKALGGTVSRNPVKEIGWGRVTLDPNAQARDWFGDMRDFLAFHWHGETFTIPPGAVRIAASPYCGNQAFVLGNHLAMQCHVEMTGEMIRTWCRAWKNERVEGKLPSVQTPEEMQVDVGRRVEALNAVARRVYDRWIQGLA
jgi:GMP synthase-like glutamine amidotransferase